MRFAPTCFFFGLSFVTACPPPESLYPCVCRNSEYFGDSISCSGIDNAQDVEYAVRVIGNASKYYSFAIESAHFMYLPHDVFKGLGLAAFEMRSTTFVALTDTDVAFEGLEGHLRRITMHNCEMFKEWDWSVFRKLQKLNVLEIKVGLRYITRDIEDINSSAITVLDLDDNELTHIYEKAFAKFEMLATIELSRNLLSELKRSMLPKPAKRLRSLLLSYNRIQELPSDMFEDMPVLYYVDLDSNELLILGEDTFSSVWNQLKNFHVSDNPLRCDCRLSWIIGRKFPYTAMDAYCDTPLGLKGKSLKDLQSTDLWCEAFYSKRTRNYVRRLKRL